MRSAAEPSNAALGRSSDLLDQVDYRLAQTPDEKEKIYNLRYRAYLREGAVKPSADQRVTDQYDDLPNSWTFGVHLFGELYSSVRISVLTSEWRQSCSNEAFGEILNPRLDRGEVIIDPARFVADPDKAKRFPELPYVTLRLAYMACEYFNADIGLARDHCRTALLPRPAEAGRIDGRELPRHARQGFRALSDDAIDRLRAADAVRARRRASIGAGRCLPVRGNLDRPAILPGRQLEFAPASLSQWRPGGFLPPPKTSLGPATR